MARLIQKFAFVLAGCLLTFSVAAAAGAKSTVKVALLDMTALMSPAAGTGYGMMGPGAMMGQGMMGQGMMGYGARGGMMGGNSGYGGPGYGMMGGGMMGGMMSIRANRTTVPTGTVSFDVTNLSRSVVHEMLVVSVDSADAPLPYDYNTWRVAEDQVKVMGETEEMQPNAEKTVDLDLAPGTYPLICNIPGHFAAGMVVPLTVTQ